MNGEYVNMVNHGEFDNSRHITAAGLIQFQQEMPSNSNNKDSMSARECEMFKFR